MADLPRIREHRGEEVRYAHVKRDGICLRVEKLYTGRVYVHTRTPTDITANVQFVPTLKNVWSHMPSDNIVWGELWYPGKPASYVKTAIAQADPKVRFEAFATSGPEDESLDVTSAVVASWGLLWAPHRRGLQSLDGLHPDIEGWVYKDGNRLGWTRQKPVRTIDLIVTGFTEGNGKYLGQVGSLICSTTEGHVIANVSGMSDEQREWFDEHIFECIERKTVVEVRYQYVGSKGRLRHPAFLRVRDDKHWTSCTIYQDRALEGYYA